jgi:nucleotide-binding universal stress UspA family protein
MHPDWPLPPEQRSDDEARAAQLAYLGGIVRALAAAEVAASSALLAGRAEDVLCENAAGCADLVVMTTHGRGPFSRFWLGSVADCLVRRLTVPLLLVRPSGEAAWETTAEPFLRRVLIPLDGSTDSESVLGPVVELGTAEGMEYTLLRAVPPPPALGWEVPGYAAQAEADLLAERLRGEAGEYLEGVARRLRAAGVRVRTRALVHPSAAGAILDAAAAGGFDLIALRTRGRGGAARLLLGSVADKVVRGAAVPVLVSRSPA